jgi:hypothetical protein
MANTKTLTERDLRQFTGTETWFCHPLNRNVLYTEGAQFIAEHGGAYWLLDAIALAQLSEKRVKAEPFQVWVLKVREDRTAMLSCGDGNDNTVYTQELQFTDFPLAEIKLWFADSVIYLPSEH